MSRYSSSREKEQAGFPDAGDADGDMPVAGAVGTILARAANAAAFETSIEQILAPSLRPEQIVILDNLSIHLGPRVKGATEARGCKLLFLSAYSPNFSTTLGAFSPTRCAARCTFG